jgi:hypothetical protein
MQQLVTLLRGGAVGEQVSGHGGDNRNVTTQLLAMPNSHLQKFFGQWKDCWSNNVVSEGVNCEGNYDGNTTSWSVCGSQPVVGYFFDQALYLPIRNKLSQ